MNAYFKIVCEVESLLLEKKHPERVKRQSKKSMMMTNAVLTRKHFFFLQKALNAAITPKHISLYLHQSQFLPMNLTYTFEHSNKVFITKYCFIIAFETSQEHLVLHSYTLMK